MNEKRNMFHNMGGWSQLFVFCFLAFWGYIFTAFFLILCIDLSAIESSARTMRLAQMINQVCLFLIPPLAFAYICHKNPKNYLKVDSSYSLSFLLLAIGLIFTIQPIVDFLGYWNGKLVLPESLSSLENWMKNTEESVGKTMALLFTDKSASGLISNLLMMAVMAGLVEEVFFRGCLQQIVQKIAKNQHIAVWVTAFIFSAIHFQFYGFVPRLLLGAILGYLFVWSGSLWVPVIVHTINNIISVLFAYFFYGTAKYQEMSEFSFEKYNWIIILGLVLSILLILIMYRRRKTIG